MSKLSKAQRRVLDGMKSGEIKLILYEEERIDTLKCLVKKGYIKPCGFYFWSTGNGQYYRKIKEAD